MAERLPLRAVATADDVEKARALFLEYAAWLAVDLCFQGFTEELASLPGAYAPPRGMLLLAGHEADPAGCIALRPLAGQAQAVGEVKRLYVRPFARGTGLGRRLVESVIEGARAIGYRELKLDTLERMADAQALYTRLGFKECAPYYVNPLDGTRYMALAL